MHDDDWEDPHGQSGLGRRTLPLRLALSTPRACAARDLSMWFISIFEDKGNRRWFKGEFWEMARRSGPAWP